MDVNKIRDFKNTYVKKSEPDSMIHDITFEVRHVDKISEDGSWDSFQLYKIRPLYKNETPICEGIAELESTVFNSLVNSVRIGYRHTARFNPFCSGTLIGKDRVHSVGHCLYSPVTGELLDPDTMEVIFFDGTTLPVKGYRLPKAMKDMSNWSLTGGDDFPVELDLYYEPAYINYNRICSPKDAIVAKPIEFFKETNMVSGK